MDEKQIAAIYQPENNPQGLWLEGVPLRDLTVEEWAALKENWQRALIDSGWYRLA